MAVPSFKALTDQYTTWDQLRMYLSSSEGGSLRIIDCNRDSLYIIRYDKATSQFDVPHVSWFRSVVWNGATNRPVCVAPSKAQEGLPESMTDLRFEQFLEGVMINVFLDSSGTVQIATRSKLDATGTFYSSKSFSDLLNEALSNQGIADLKQIFTDGYTFASLLLQHPEHRIVAKLTEPKVYMIHRGSVTEDGQVLLDQTDSSVLPGPPLLEGVTDIAGIVPYVQGLAEKNGWMWQGLVMKQGLNRWRLRSNAYSMVRMMRGDSPRMDVRFLRIRSKQLMETYLYYYADEKFEMGRLEQHIRSITQQLYQAYVAAHITHTCKFADLAPHWKTHVFSLHSLYLNSMRGKGHFVRKQDVIDYVNRLPIPRLLHLMKTCV